MTNNNKKIFSPAVIVFLILSVLAWIWLIVCYAAEFSDLYEMNWCISILFSLITICLIIKNNCGINISPDVLKKILIAFGSCVVISAIGFGIYWNATSYERERGKLIKEITSRTSYAMVYISDKYENDPILIDSIAEELEYRASKGRFDTLSELAGFILEEDMMNDRFERILINCFYNAKSIEEAETIKMKFGGPDWYFLTSQMVLTKESPLIASYIDEHGTRTYTTTPGQGYYANEKDDSSSHTVGLEDSPLHKSQGTKYKGDFMVKYTGGVRLNEYYQEERYYSEKWYFRGQFINFSLEDGEVVWSGDYLFLFSKDGTFIYRQELTNIK